jgi:hypothetical protein
MQSQALAQDQLRSLLSITGDGSHLPVSCAVCDGDTNQCDRARIMFPAEVGAVNVILTNPDMLHCTLLPEVQRHVLSLLCATCALRTVCVTSHDSANHVFWSVSSCGFSRCSGLGVAITVITIMWWLINGPLCLPVQHRTWKRVFENIRFVVIDEAHQYR